ncbi:hypothetical protein KW785_00400 [Candidatus Parcubacteria bacterium]|nr:hypothetical protein [Candidatus Parcubacteria bacterium]
MKRLFLIATVLLVVAFGYFYYRSRSTITVTNLPSAGNATDQSALLQETIDTLSKFVVLPEGDEPVLGIVSDPEALAGEAFFKGAQVGDRVLIYPKARKAILYRPSIGKIIEIESIPETTSNTQVGI